MYARSGQTRLAQTLCRDRIAPARAIGGLWRAFPRCWPFTPLPGVVRRIAALCGPVAGLLLLTVPPVGLIVRDNRPHLGHEACRDQVADPVIERLSAESVARVNLLALPLDFMPTGGQQGPFECGLHGLPDLRLHQVGMLVSKPYDFVLDALSMGKPAQGHTGQEQPLVAVALRDTVAVVTGDSQEILKDQVPAGIDAALYGFIRRRAPGANVADFGLLLALRAQYLECNLTQGPAVAVQNESVDFFALVAGAHHPQEAGAVFGGRVRAQRLERPDQGVLASLPDGQALGWQGFQQPVQVHSRP